MGEKCISAEAAALPKAKAHKMSEVEVSGCHVVQTRGILSTLIKSGF